MRFEAWGFAVWELGLKAWDPSHLLRSSNCFSMPSPPTMGTALRFVNCSCSILEGVSVAVLLW